MPESKIGTAQLDKMLSVWRAENEWLSNGSSLGPHNETFAELHD